MAVSAYQGPAKETREEHDQHKQSRVIFLYACFSSQTSINKRTHECKIQLFFQSSTGIIVSKCEFFVLLLTNAYSESS